MYKGWMATKNLFRRKNSCKISCKKAYWPWVLDLTAQQLRAIRVTSSLFRGASDSVCGLALESPFAHFSRSTTYPLIHPSICPPIIDPPFLPSTFIHPFRKALREYLLHSRLWAQRVQQRKDKNHPYPWRSPLVRGRHEATTHSNTVLLTGLGIDLTQCWGKETRHKENTQWFRSHEFQRQARATHGSRLQKQLPGG